MINVGKETNNFQGKWEKHTGKKAKVCKKEEEHPLKSEIQLVFQFILSMCTHDIALD